MELVLKARRVFTGSEMLRDHAVVIAGGTITAVRPAAGLRNSSTFIDLSEGILAPGFIDIQVNGGGGVNLNTLPTRDGVIKLFEAHRRFGTTAMLPTVITDTPEVQKQAVAAVSKARETHAGVLGIHIEGPFLDSQRKGAHDASLIRPMLKSDLDWLKSLRCGEVLVTLAPNKVAPEKISELTHSAIHVALGHAEASFSEANLALAAGAKGFTHIFNAMSQIGPRQAGMAGAALLAQEAYVGLIADGFHVDQDVMKLVFALKPKGRIMLVTDAMSTAAGGPQRFELQGRNVALKDGKLQLDDGTLAGSNLTMDEAVRFCVNRMGLSVEDALYMASGNAAAFLGLKGKLGSIAPGAVASMVHLSDDLKVKQTWVAGK